MAAVSYLKQKDISLSAVLLPRRRARADSSFARSLWLRVLKGPTSTDHNLSFQDPEREKTRDCLHIFQMQCDTLTRQVLYHSPIHPPTQVLKVHSFLSGVILSGN
jgi:hypothetical protein